MQLINTTPVLELNTHLSFPAILRREGHIYIYPENYAGGGLNLYEYLPESNECKKIKHLSDELVTDAVYTELFGEPLIFSTCEPDANGAVLGVYQQNKSTGMYQLVQECKFGEPIAVMQVPGLRTEERFIVPHRILRCAMGISWSSSGCVVRQMAVSVSGKCAAILPL